MRVAAIGLFLCPLVACSATPEASEAPATTASGKADDANDRSGLRHWYLIGNALTPGHDVLEGELEVSDSVGAVEILLDGGSRGTVKVQDGRVHVEQDLRDLPPGEHVLTLVEDGTDDNPLLEHTFMRSHPLYIVVSNDWDTSDHDDGALRRQERLHADHSELRLTHFVGPYTFTDAEVPEERKQLLVQWVTNLRDTEGDEIGLHIHPYCHFVEAAGVACRTEPEYAQSWRDPGYTVFCSAYEEDEFVTLLNHADALFAANGLGKPTSFRAGGWSLDLHTLRALGRAGYVADTSANNYARLEEWEGKPGTSLYDWNAERWAPINDTSQPWWPSADDLFGTTAPFAGVLEVPDNGILVDYVSAQEMIEMFEANWDGSALPSPRQYSIGYHPVSFTAPLYERIDEALFHIDGFLASQDAGPVVYARLSDLVHVWPMPTE